MALFMGIDDSTDTASADYKPYINTFISSQVDKSVK